MEPSTRAFGESGKTIDHALLQMQQDLTTKIRTGQYTEALSLSHEILKITPHNSLIQHLRNTLAEKVELDKNDVKEETASDKESSDSASSLDEESDDEEHDSSESASTSGSDSGATIAAATVCDVLHVSSDKRALSALPRKQISNALKNQLADLKVQQASKP